MNENTLKSVLVVDDEPDICELAEITLSRMGLQTQSANDLTTAKKILASQHFDLCLTDMNLPDGNGIELIEFIQKNNPQTPVAVITAYGNMESAVCALKAGAFDFVSKPIDLQVLRKLVSSAIKLPQTGSATTSDENTGPIKLLGESNIMQALRKKINKLARSQAPVFIHGESGSGKELVAQLIHQQGSRADKPFIPINCGAIPSELVESEFFGHKKGSFTGASSDKNGLFKAADEGTLFLDEVADLPMQMQVKLLRAIQEKTIRPIGAHQEYIVDVRILSASHKNLADLVKQGNFREDLYYRINVIELNVPALKNRPGDITLITQHLLTRLAKQSHLASNPQLSNDAMNALENYPFPGNVRELENILERAIALIDTEIIEKDDLQLPQAHTQTPDEQASTVESAIESTPNEQNLNLKDQEKDVIVQALEQNRWNKTAAAKQLGLSLRQLRYRLEKLNIE
ncbi:Type IV fimbriae expression regulatory protein PilR [hydrothermal vent metagenome]|uniref:Type IV fimbriae expression regulatory protein PilR n=1 Tax=hydrothermal vent metagenome TaxID=652676 RepID=A0A3B0WL99_9ZZZZ